MSRPSPHLAASAQTGRERRLPAKAYFDAFAPHLDKRAWSRDTAPWAAWAWSIVEQEISDTDGLIVDLGTGTGAGILNLLRIAPKARFLGVDFSDVMIACARRKSYCTAEGGPADVAFEVCRIDRLRLPAASVDYFISAGTFHHIKNKQYVASRILKMLKLGGKFINIDHFRSGPRYRRETDALRLRHPELTAENDRVRASFQWLYDQDRQHPIEFHTDPYEFATILKRSGFVQARVHASLLADYAVVAGYAPDGTRETV
jgi:ubiquinone/menaquinone biosynthesis C-methylase UbiE